MRFAADLHVHSRYSRATSREADLAGYYRWARVKGIQVVGTGDFTHPAWFSQLQGELVERDGLYALKNPPRESALEGAEPADAPVRFMLTTEISSIFRKHGEVRKVHSLIGVPTLEHARRVGAKLATIGNIASDGRPILGLDPKDLLAIVLEVSADSFLIPAHVWTPWFSLFGSKSGFDRIEDCFEELTPHIFALETGLSSDPPMNRRWSALDRYRLVSNSDAHSPGKLGREATLFDTEPSWRGIVDAMRTGQGLLGTCEFFPEEGKYHFDGHRNCGVCMDPEQTLASGGICSVCGTPVTVGVLHRVLSLADRLSAPPGQAAGYRSIIPLSEILGELLGTGDTSRAVARLYARIIGAFGSEYAFLLDAPVDDIERSQGRLLAEAVRRMREGRIDPQPGYDGEFGVIRVFAEAELERLRGQDELFPATTRARGRRPLAGDAAPVHAAKKAGPPVAGEDARGAGENPQSLDAEQDAIAGAEAARALVVAGPGTGKTRLLVGWIARHAAARGARPGRVLALTFTNRAAAELGSRLARRSPALAASVLAGTFHSFCWSLLRESDPTLFTIVSASQRRWLLQALLPETAAARIREIAERMERHWEGMEETGAEPDAETRKALALYEEELRRAGAADISSLVFRLVALLRSDERMRARLAASFRAVAVDELQDINRPQYELLTLLSASADAVLCIGDPEQAIYGFRGSDRALFFRFRDETGAAVFTLSRNYRSTATIVAAADAFIAPARAAGFPRLAAARGDGPRIRTFRAQDPADEGRFIGATIRSLVGGVDAVSVDAARAREAGSYAFSDIAVLFRTRAVRDALLPGLAAAGLPLAIRENAPLAEEEPFRSLVAALRLVANPADSIALRLLQAGEGAAGIDAFIARCPELARRISAEGIGPVIDEILRTVVGLDRSAPALALGEDALRDAAAEHGSDLPGFLAAVSLCARESEGPRSAQKVSLLTFHAAKGLEFPVVFIAGAEEGITPLPDDPEEERRLFYVALTRAREQVFVTHCGRRTVHGQARSAAPSPFLDDIPESCRRPEPLPSDAGGRQLTLF